MIRYHVMIAFPIACLLLGFAGFLLGSGSSRRQDSSGKKTGISLTVLVFFYTLYGIGSATGNAGSLPPSLAISLCNLFLLGVNGWMIRGLRRWW